MPLPDVGNGQVTLRVAHAINPRFPKLSEAQLDELLRAAAASAQRHLGLQVSYQGPARVISLEQLLRGIPKPVAERHLAWVEAVRHGAVDRGALIGGYEGTIAANPVPAQEVIEYARRLTDGTLQARDARELATFLADRHIARVRQLRDLAGNDGSPLVDHTPYNEVLFWDAVGFGDLPYDVIVTNQPIVSLEYGGGDVHTGLRGGISVGMTFYSQSGRYGSAIVWSTYPFTSTGAPFTELRGGAVYPDGEAVKLAGILMAHEFGHLLLHLGHPFGNAACIMHPTPLLRFREQVAALDAEKCPVGASPAMKPGAIPIPYYE